MFTHSVDTYGNDSREQSPGGENPEERENIRRKTERIKKLLRANHQDLMRKIYPPPPPKSYQELAIADSTPTYIRRAGAPQTPVQQRRAFMEQMIRKQQCDLYAERLKKRKEGEEIEEMMEE